MAEQQSLPLEPPKTMPQPMVEFIAGFVARIRYGEKRTAQQNRDADRLAAAIAEQIMALP